MYKDTMAMLSVGTIIARKMNRPRLTLGSRHGYEMLRSSTLNGWKSGFTVDNASAMAAATLHGCHSFRFLKRTEASPYIMINHSNMYETASRLRGIIGQDAQR